MVARDTDGERTYGDFPAHFLRWADLPDMLSSGPDD